MNTPVVLSRVGVSLLLVACAASATPAERLVGGPCEGCEAVFEGRPPSLASAAPLASPAEPGERLLIEGVVRDPGGAPAAGIIVYAYQTDASGLYPAAPDARHRHGRLRAFVRTDATGHYAFSTVRPGGYPATALPQHVHMHVVEPGRCHYYIDDLVFTDDPRLTPTQRAAHAHGRGGSGVVTPTRRDVAGRAVWQARRDIALGAGIADHDRCAGAGGG